MELDTLAANTGVGYDCKGSISVPIYQTATFQHPALNESTGFDYSRSGNPTRLVLEKGIAALENGNIGLAYPSGMSAITNVFMFLGYNSHLIMTEDIYGGTYRLLNEILNQYHIEATYVDTTNLQEITNAIQEDTAAIFIESPTNPLLKVCDLKAIAQIAHQNNILLIVDNTFLTPYLQNPLQLGADIVIHSASKYLGGHNDLIAGLVAVKDQEIGDKLYFWQNSTGSILSPHESWLLLRGIKTLGIRMEKQQQNAVSLARWLQNHPQVTRVYYPGLPDNPGYLLNLKQARGYGAMISFEVRTPELIPRFLEHIELISFAESLGGIETLVTFPYTQTHGDINEETRNSLGINNRLLRLSIGIEDQKDLIQDMEVALS